MLKSIRALQSSCAQWVHVLSISLRNHMDYVDIKSALHRIKGLVQTTPIVESKVLNHCLGHKILFKAECLQTTGAFKLRGATNFITKMREDGIKCDKIVANSSGNHAQAVSYAGRKFDYSVDIYSAKSISAVKAAATRSYGATLHLFNTRVEADNAVQKAGDSTNTMWIPPYNHPDIIAGQGTAAVEAFHQLSGQDINAIVAPCGGGGLLSGCLIATRKTYPKASVIGVEPLNANDAAESLRQGKIVSLKAPAQTLADGAGTPSVGAHTFPLLQQLDDFYEVNESSIVYWTQWLHHLLKLHIEPTCAMSMQGLVEWLRTKKTHQTVLVILSGGNISAESMSKIWQHDQLNELPTITRTQG